MRVHVQRWGNSLALRIPKPFAEDVEVKEGSAVDLSVSDGTLVAAPVRKRKASLKRLLVIGPCISNRNLIPCGHEATGDCGGVGEAAPTGDGPCANGTFAVDGGADGWCGGERGMDLARDRPAPWIEWADG